MQMHCLLIKACLGEELEAIWEIEPGAQIIERAGLLSITGQDDSNTIDAFLDAVCWGAATNADRGFQHRSMIVIVTKFCHTQIVF